MNKIVVIDVQGFKSLNNTFILKEVAICFSDSAFRVLSIKPPFKFNMLSEEEKKSAIWLKKYHHGLDWDEGQFNLEEAINYLNFHVKHYNIFVKGAEKTQWIRDLLSPNFKIHEIKHRDCNLSLKSLIQMYPVNYNCGKNHENLQHTCALKNALALRHFIEKHIHKFL